jgi:hypothetical protein
MSLYTDLLNAGVPVSNWQSDLYFPITPKTRAILAKYPKQYRSTFTSNIDGSRMYECPFAFDPFWERKV